MESTLDLAKINQAGEDVLSDATKMYQSLEKIKNLIDGSTSFFDSEAGDAIRRKFNTSAEKFREFEAFIKTYGEYMKTYAGNVQTFKDAVEQVVDGFHEL